MLTSLWFDVTIEDMYIERVPNRKSPPAVLVRESFREDGKVRKRTLANLSAATSARMDTVDASTAMIIEFGDYECPFCRDSDAHLEAVMESHPDVTIGFRHYPLTAIHPKAEDAARAAICAEEQGRFQQIHSLLFGSTEWRDIGDWKTLAENAGVADLAAYESCLMSEATGRRLEEDRRLGEALGLTSTPTFFYQFGRHVGYATEEQFLELIEQSR